MPVCILLCDLVKASPFALYKILVRPLKPGELKMGWCGSDGSASLLGSALSACQIQTAFGTVLVLLVCLSAALQWKRFSSRKSPTEISPSRPILGTTGLESAHIFCVGFLAFVHLAHVAITAIYFKTELYHLYYEITMCAAWAILLTTDIMATTSHAVLRYMSTSVVALLLYSFAVFMYWSMYIMKRTRPEENDKALYLKLELWSAQLQVVVSAILISLERKRAALTTTPEGYMALPDVETGDAKKERTWMSLFIEACRYVWPRSRALQARVILSSVLLVFIRVLNILVPYFYKSLVDQLSRASVVEPGERPPFTQLVSPWLVLYLVAIFFQGGAGGGIVGFINNARQYLWIPVSQDAYRRVALTVFSHVLDLDLTFHLKRKTGEVTKVVDRGTNAIQNVLSTVLFSIGPQMFDVLAAATYLSMALEPWIALIMFVTIGSYIPMTIMVTEWRGSIRRDMNKAENALGARVTDALLNYETVKYFCNEEHEAKQYAGVIADYQGAEFRFLASLNVLNVMQSLVMFMGIASGMLACTAGVARGSLTVGDVVLFLTLMAQLYAPLNFFGTYYRVIQQYMIDMENLFDLLERKAVVEDRPGAHRAQLGDGSVEYDKVSFEYEHGAPVLRDVSFKVPGGKTIAFVGATGSGKSTLTRLLFRFYDVSGGAVRVDGQDVRNVTQASLRQFIGMVPQDTVLFNDTIRYNIAYGCIGASEDQVIRAAQAACIHDAITERFPKGYDTVVGERGLRLSGGEKQRVAFARALLKNPAILVLDEATSALDTITERKIQAALRESRQQRTTLIVAHRLSTIADADIIVVMKDGAVVETGEHQELLALDGLYAEMWSKQAQQQQQQPNGELLIDAAADSQLPIT